MPVMGPYIIQLQIWLNGQWQIRYHKKITRSRRKDTNNTYVVHVTAERSQACAFSDREEAERVANLFKSNIKIPTVQDL